RTFKTINPATGKVLAEVAEAAEADIDMAVAAARRAFDGPWSKFKPFDRQAVLLKLADLVDTHFDELAILDTLDMGSPIASTQGRRRRG
ncbi:aldehyde dehydrogenase family protein, partial [Enterococcus faecalis]|uniref:aldehyde dehydrogenase family protein n=1 Tax=Enterococcus faecalis TaxID=1351 RepID=UPI003D6AF98E